MKRIVSAICLLTALLMLSGCGSPKVNGLVWEASSIMELAVPPHTYEDLGLTIKDNNYSADMRVIVQGHSGSIHIKFDKQLKVMYEWKMTVDPADRDFWRSQIVDNCTLIKYDSNDEEWLINDTDWLGSGFIFREFKDGTVRIDFQCGQVPENLRKAFKK